MKVVLFLCSYFTCVSIYGQDNYFQQQVDYKIEVELIDSIHTLDGKIAITYTNNSQESLDKIYFHLWPNAYNSKYSPFAQQQIDIGRTDFHFAREEEMGGISKLDFKVNGQKAAFQINKREVDTGILLLNQDLQPGEIITITTPFTVQVPESFSRMGSTEGAYQLTQWYPKPAVYDRDGWHVMSYLDMGEFYSEFGSFDVTITTPSEYVLASSGTLVSEEQNGDTHTRQFTAEDVHDFAWFVDLNFKVKSAPLLLPSGKEITVSVYHTAFQEDLWSQSLEYAKRALTYFSEHVGEYPYPQYTVVQSALQAGGGMEYPMITVIDEVLDAQELDHVIAHEIGHSWFYGILASNERAHPWMDEGMTTYFDHRYINRYYQDDHFSNLLPGFIAKKMDFSVLQTGHQYFNQKNIDEKVSAHSEDMSMENYVMSAYVKAPLALQYLESYLGTEEIDRLFQGYYQKWKFKHPGPLDVEHFFVENATKDISWFFDYMINSNAKIDYQLKKAQKIENGYNLTLGNKRVAAIPILISAIKDKEVVASQWVDSFAGESNFDFDIDQEVDGFTIDVEGASWDINRRNNYLKTKGLFKKVETPEFAFLTGPDNKKSSRTYFTPYVAYNVYDGVQLGANLTKAFIPDSRILKTGFLGYGFGSKEPVGTINLRFNKYFEGDKPRYLTTDFHLRRFSSNSFRDIDIQYIKFSPSIQYNFKKGKKSKVTHSIFYKANYLNDEYYDFSDDEVGVDQFNSLNHTVGYSFKKKHSLTPLSGMIAIEQESYANVIEESHDFMKWMGEFNLGFQYARGKHLDIRLFASSFLNNTQREVGSVDPALVRGAIPLMYQGHNDYRYDNYHFGRSEQDGFAARQIHHGQGGFKNALSSAFSTLGTSNDYAIAINAKVDFPPLNLPIKLYFDYGIYNSKSTSSGSFERKSLYSTGVAIEWLDGGIGIYLPIVNSSDINTAYNTIADNYLGRISFSLELTKFNLWDILEQVGR